MRVVAVGQFHNKFVRPGTPRGGLHLVVVRPRAAIGNVVKHGAREQVHILLHHADVAAQAFERQPLDILPVDEDAALAYIIKAGYEVAQRGLARAAGPHQRYILAGGHRQRQVVQHRAILRVRVVEADVVKGDIALHIFQRYGARRVGDFKRRVHDFLKALDARHAALELLGKLHQPADGGQQHVDVQQVTQVLAGRDVPLPQEQRAHHHHDDVGDAVQQAGGDVKARHHPVLLDFQAEEFLVALAELFVFDVLVGKALHHAHAQQAVLSLGVDFAQLPAPGGKRLADAAVKLVGGVQQEGQHQENHQRQRYVDPQQDDEGDGYLDQRDEKLLRAVVGELRHVKQVAGHAAHQLADFGVVVIGEGQLLQVAEQVGAHVRLDAGAHDVPAGLHIIIRPRVHQPQRHIQQRRAQHEGHGDAGGGGDSLVCNGAYDQRENQLARGGQHRAHQVERQHAQMRLVVGQKPADVV